LRLVHRLPLPAQEARVKRILTGFSDTQLMYAFFVPLLSFVLFLIALAAIVYPFPPFETRTSTALLALIAFVNIGLAAPLSPPPDQLSYTYWQATGRYCDLEEDWTVTCRAEKEITQAVNSAGTEDLNRELDFVRRDQIATLRVR